MKDQNASAQTTTPTDRIYVIADENRCGKCGSPAYRYGHRLIHMRCTTCDFDSANIWPAGAYSPKGNNDV